MRPSSVLICTALAIALSVPTLGADLPRPDTGNGLLALCSITVDSPGAEIAVPMCVGYLTGVWQSLKAMGQPPYTTGGATHLYWSLNLLRIDWDVVAKTTPRQLIDVILKYLKEHPEMRHLDSPILIQNALAVAFPGKHLEENP